MNRIEETLAMMELVYRCETLERERDEWRECCERMLWSAPATFANNVEWLKAMLLAKKLIEKQLATRRVDAILDQKKEGEHNG
jgi:hypothetical protein